MTQPSPAQLAFLREASTPDGKIARYADRTAAALERQGLVRRHDKRTSSPVYRIWLTTAAGEAAVKANP